MPFLSEKEERHLERLLKTFFMIPYSTDLDGKDAETLIRIVKGITTEHSRRKELFDIVDGEIGYSVKTLRKKPTASKVDLQEQRFCDVDDIREMQARGRGVPDVQGEILLTYMAERIDSEMERRNVTKARSLILLKDWDEDRRNFTFRYWEEDFKGYIYSLIAKNEAGEIEWVFQPAGLHGRDKSAPKLKDKHPRLIRMHYKHNQIFTDHAIPSDALSISFKSEVKSWDDLSEILFKEKAQPSA